MCIHRDQYDEGVQGDQQYVTDLLADSEGYPRFIAAAKLLQKNIDQGIALTETVQERVWDAVSEADEAGTLAELVA